MPAQLDRAIGRFWLPRELSGWRRWLFKQATQRRLVLGGIDDQLSETSDYGRAVLPGLVSASLPPQSASKCEQAVTRNLYRRYDVSQPFDEPEQLRLQRCVRSAADAFVTRARRQRVTLEQAVLANLAGYVDRQRGIPEAPDRDKVMFRNVLWYIGRMPAGSQVIIWTSTVHAARHQYELPQLPLGAQLDKRWGRSLATIGFTAFAGQSSRAGQPIQLLPEAPPNSLEARATETNAAWVFLDSSALRRIGNVPSRLLGKVTSADWSLYFDAVLVMRQESAPVFEPW